MQERYLREIAGIAKNARANLYEIPMFADEIKGIRKLKEVAEIIDF